MLPLLMLVLFGVMMYFTTSKQKKQMKEHQEKLDSIQAGDKVVTIGGLHGVVADVRTTEAGKTILIDCEGIYLEFDRAAIKTIIPGTGMANTVTEPVEETVETTETAVEEITEVPEVAETNEETSHEEPKA
ncbi:preprotein translocase subunit YajC [Vagococcus xieshaowenii]|uniref:Preprotein translocase subunit YajC n=1 Tax=Vagococcus xieshaowenii TaxID=2562451 RepID=A0AAJ5JL40_9ENTE|nr:preprotein translocase subunit YajC [Vagococcus xieshaowenii]QCA27989.1 preprotein translocase subunit YajC [Vagococcus xieshaowenii]TFZ41244.1 preprotein translocase subunit YajC [Vagococcus xieshaowenii]